MGKKYDIYKDEENSGQQFPTDTGPIDILAISKDKKEVLVVELKKGRASDAVVGQIQRYMGYITEFITEDTQQVKGIIIALDEDQRIKFALFESDVLPCPQSTNTRVEIPYEFQVKRRTI